MSEIILHRIIDTSPDLADTTRNKYRRDLAMWIEFAGTDPKGWTRYRFEEFYAKLLKKMKPQSANRLISGIRYAARWWSSNEGKPELDFTHIRTKTVRNSDVDTRQALSEHEAVQIVKACWGTHPIDLRDFGLVVLGLETGMRRMSLAAVHFESFGQPYGYPTCAVPLKGHGTDLFHVPLSDTAILALGPWRAWLDGQRVKTGPLFRQLDKGSSIGDDGISETRIHNVIASRAERAGIKRAIFPHLFRHTFVTSRISMNVSPEVRAAITGHKIPSIGAMANYVDRQALGAIARTTTPPWLSELVRSILNS